MTSMIKTTLMLTAITLITVSSQSVFAQDEFNYSVHLQSNGELTVMNAKGEILKGVVDNRPIK